jgi:hypothetical protein
MGRMALACLAIIGALVIAGSPATASDPVILFDFTGYDYWTWMPDTCYNAVGEVPSADPAYLTFDPTKQYTFSLQGVCLVSTVTFGCYTSYTFEGGTLDVYCDDLLAGGTDFDYGINPPNATSPSSFEDGELILGADVQAMTILWNTCDGTASLEGGLDFVRGTQLGNIPLEQRGGFTLAGAREDAPGIPEGYFWQIDGIVEIPGAVPTESRSWGSLKIQYQGGN